MDSAPTRRLNATSDPNLTLKIAQLAVTQHGIVTLSQLARLGASQSAVTRRARKGQLYRVHRGVYSVTPVSLLRPRGVMLAAVFALGPAAVLSGHSAAELHDVTGVHRTVSSVTVSTPGGRSAPDRVVVVRSTTLRPDRDVTAIDGIPVTTLARTIFDLAGELNAARLERIVDSALQSGELDLGALREQIAHNRHRGANGGALRKILANDTIGGQVSWNDFEKSFLALIDELGLPRPGVRRWLDLGDGEPMIEPDFMWRELKLIVETDGWTEHGSRKRFETDRRRDQRVAAAGIQAVRVTWRQLHDDRALTGRLLARTVRQRQSLFTAPVERRAA